jgi:hypothetical protein
VLTDWADRKYLIFIIFTMFVTGNKKKPPSIEDSPVKKQVNKFNRMRVRLLIIMVKGTIPYGSKKIKIYRDSSKFVKIKILSFLSSRLGQVHNHLASRKIPNFKLRVLIFFFNFLCFVHIST